MFSRNLIKLISLTSPKNITATSYSLNRFICSTSPLATYQSTESETKSPFPEPKRWPEKNLKIHQPDEPLQERYYCHHRSNIKYSPKKMWYIACFLRGMQIDEAINQLRYIPKKGAAIVAEVLEEAREIALKEHNFEFRSKMWIAESFCTKGFVMKGIRKHARMRFGEVRYFHCHYFVRLVEGDPPKDYWGEYKDGNQKLKEYIEELRNRRIEYGL